VLEQVEVESRLKWVDRGLCFEIGDLSRNIYHVIRNNGKEAPRSPPKENFLVMVLKM
jgi:hypothetical protein